jgi:hypothetical protein
MEKRNLSAVLSVSSIFSLLVLAVLIIQASLAVPVAAQTQPCVDPLTGAQCTPTQPSPNCGLPGLPACDNPPANPAPTRVVIYPTRPPLPTSTPSPTSSPTVTATPTATITPIPTGTPFPSPTPKPALPPLLAPLPNLIGLFHPPLNVVAQLPPWLSPYNIKVTDLEITQAIQCLHNSGCADNSVALYSGKTTIVRAYLTLTTGPTVFVSGIGGALCYGNTGAGGCTNPILPIKKVLVESVKDPVAADRGYASMTLDFVLPASYVSGFTTQTLTVYANYKFMDLPSEAFYKDNFKTLTYQVTPSKPIYVRFHPVQNKGVLPPAFEWATLTDYLVKTYPTGQVYPSLGMPLYGKDYPWTTPGGGCGMGWGNLLNDLWYMRGGSGPIAYGEVPAATITMYGGCGYMGSPEAAGLAGTASDGRVAAQEVGHTLNLPHVPGCGAGGPDLSYPNSSGLLDEYGIDPYTMKVYPPSWSYDFMGYCGGGTNTWTSIYTYNEIAGLLPSGAYHPSTYHLAAPINLLQPEQVLVGSGDLSPTSASLTQGFYLLDRTSFKTLTPDAGSYTVELQDASGHVLYTQHFDLAQLSNDDPQTEGGFRLVLPWTDGVKKTVYKYQDQVIGHTTASAHAPTLALTSPSGGESWVASGQQTITWTAADADHNPLSYMVQYSSDGGVTWSMLAANLTDTSFTFDGDYLPGSDHGVLRVLATDGFNTTFVDSNQITVAAKAPLIAITSPLASISFDFGAPVILQAAGTDLQDGPLTNGEQFAWSSSRDGSIGSGNPLILTNLSVGTHTLTLSVRNASGLVSTASVNITILPADTSANPNAVGFGDYLPLVLLFVLLVVVIIVVFLVIRRSKMRKA